MSGRASVYLARTTARQTVLVISGYYPHAAMAGKPMTVEVTLPGAKPSEHILRGPDGNFEIRVPVEASTPLNSQLEVGIRATPVLRVGVDVRPLTLAVRQIGLAAGK